MLQMLPVNDCEFALSRIVRACEEIRKINNRISNPQQQQQLLSLTKAMAINLENTVAWAEHLKRFQG
jgi:hypothetical protein